MILHMDVHPQMRRPSSRAALPQLFGKLLSSRGHSMVFSCFIIRALAKVFLPALDFIKSIQEVCANGDRLDNQNNIKPGQAAAALVSAPSLPAWACCLWPGSPASTWVVPSTRNSTEHRGQVSFQHCSVPLFLSSDQARHRG